MLNKTKFAVVIITMLVVTIFTGCQKEYIFNYNDIVGETFSNSVERIEFLSQDSLIWTISVYRDTPIAYKLPYMITDGAFTLAEFRDALRHDYINEYTGENEFVTKYLSDRLSGRFESSSELDCDNILHTYNEKLNDLYSFGSGYISFATTLSKE